MEGFNSQSTQKTFKTRITHPTPSDAKTPQTFKNSEISSLNSAIKKINELENDNKKLVQYLKKMKIRVSQLNSRTPSACSSLNESSIFLAERKQSPQI
jgi:hypothetical protein